MSAILKKMTLLSFILPALVIVVSYYTGLAVEAPSTMLGWLVTLATFAILLGVISFVRHHLLRAYERQQHWEQSVIAIASFSITFILALTFQPGYNYIINNVSSVLQIALIGIIGFYSCTIFYRAARIRNAEVGLLLVSAILIMLGLRLLER